MVLKPEAFQKCFEEWIASGVEADATGQRRLVAIDGKCCRRSHDAAKDWGPLHIVSAWAGEQGIALGQVAAADKSDEITAIPALLTLLDLTNSIVTIDAIGCQKAIAKQIVTEKRHFVIAVKDNQPKLFQTIRDFFCDHLERDLEELRYREYETEDVGHGRIDERAYLVTKIPKDFAMKKEWPWIKAIGYAVRLTIHADGRETHDVRYYILSRYLSGPRFGEAVRGHWGIECQRPNLLDRHAAEKFYAEHRTARRDAGIGHDFVIRIA